MTNVGFLGLSSGSFDILDEVTAKQGKENVFVYDSDQQHTRDIVFRGVHVLESPTSVAMQCSVLFLSGEPSVLHQILSSVRLNDDHLLVVTNPAFTGQQIDLIKGNTISKKLIISYHPLQNIVFIGSESKQQHIALIQSLFSSRTVLVVPQENIRSYSIIVEEFLTYIQQFLDALTLTGLQCDRDLDSSVISTVTLHCLTSLARIIDDPTAASLLRHRQHEVLGRHELENVLGEAIQRAFRRG
ncbi:hypothetical protein GEMRC1_006258 [Eukaryota sp. GEM-RC1]